MPRSRDDDYDGEPKRSGFPAWAVALIVVGVAVLSWMQAKASYEAEAEAERQVRLVRPAEQK